MDRRQLHGTVGALAELILQDGLSDAFLEEARRASTGVGPNDFPEIRRLFHDPPPEPDVYDVTKHGLGGWLSACQFAAFELIFHSGAAALPFLREIAWGEYDWTQGNAIELLIRLAATGIEPDEIIAEIKRNFPDIRYEAQLYALDPLLSRLQADAGLRAIFEHARPSPPSSRN